MVEGHEINLDAPSLPSQVPGLLRRRLGRYDLIGEIARGGMGTVYLARHVGEAGFQRLFAVKVLHPHLARQDACVDMLLDEARIAARLHHPNAVAIVDLGSEDDLHYVVLDYVEGVSFSTMIKHRASPSFAEIAVTVLCDVLDGLHAAHSLSDDAGRALQLVHRDVSPQNILVGADGTARITDFGIAKAESRLVSTQPGGRKGKLGFMAPEQIMADASIDRRADVWAAGVVLWTALTGKHLFRSSDDVRTVERVLHKSVQPPSASAPDVVSCFDEVVLRALQRDRNARYASALEMAEALRAAAAAHGLSCARHAVGKWVTEHFREAFLSRREAIREASRALEQLEATKEVSRLSALPKVGGHGVAVYGSLSSWGAKGSTTNALHPSPSRSSSPLGFSLPPDARRARRDSWVVVGALSALLAVAFLYLRWTNEAASKGDGASAAAAAGVQAASRGMPQWKPGLERTRAAPDPVSSPSPSRPRPVPARQLAVERRDRSPRSADPHKGAPQALARSAQPSRERPGASEALKDVESTTALERDSAGGVALSRNESKASVGNSTFESNPYVRKRPLN